MRENGERIGRHITAWIRRRDCHTGDKTTRLGTNSEFQRSDNPSVHQFVLCVASPASTCILAYSTILDIYKIFRRYTLMNNTANDSDPHPSPSSQLRASMRECAMLLAPLRDRWSSITYRWNGICTALDSIRTDWHTTRYLFNLVSSHSIERIQCNEPISRSMAASKYILLRLDILLSQSNIRRDSAYSSSLARPDCLFHSWILLGYRGTCGLRNTHHRSSDFSPTAPSSILPIRRETPKEGTWRCPPTSHLSIADTQGNQ